MDYSFAAVDFGKGTIHCTKARLVSGNAVKQQQRLQPGRGRAFLPRCCAGPELLADLLDVPRGAEKPGRSGHAFWVFMLEVNLLTT